MICERKKEIQVWLDSHPGNSLHGELKQHLSGCTECSIEYERLNAVHQILLKMSADTAPEGTDALIMAKVMKLRKAGNRANPLMIVIPIMLLTFVGFSYLLFKTDISHVVSLLPMPEKLPFKVTLGFSELQHSQYRETILFSALLFLAGSVYVLYERFKTIK